jgi:hypothetical protein
VTRGGALVTTLVIGCAAGARPAEHPEAARTIAAELGARVTKAGCPVGRAELVQRTAAEWGARPFSDTWGPDWKCLAIEDDLGRD